MGHSSKRQYKEIAKHLNSIFQIVDPNIKNLSYVQFEEYDLYEYEFINSTQYKYINVTGLSPYDVFKTAVNTLDHYNLDYLFLSDQKVEEIFKDDPFQYEIETELE